MPKFKQVQQVVPKLSYTLHININDYYYFSILHNLTILKRNRSANTFDYCFGTKPIVINIAHHSFLKLIEFYVGI